MSAPLCNQDSDPLEDAARELPNLPLEDALQLVHLYFERGSPKYERAKIDDQLTWEFCPATGELRTARKSKKRGAAC